MDDEKKFCQNCKRDIPSANHEMHVIHCQRNIQLCPTCEEPVPRSEMEKHKEEFHAIIACPECRVRMEGSAINDHKENQCSKRILPCQYCDLELKADEMPEHENYCGSRTEDCEVCGKIYMLKFRDVHFNSNHRLTQPNDNSNSESDDNPEDVEENLRNNYPSRFGRNSLLRNRENNHSRRAVPYENNSRRNQGRNHLQDYELDEYFGNLGIENIRNPQSSNSFHASANRPTTGHREEPTYIPCEFCEVPILSDELVLHQTGCRPDLISHQSTTTRPTESWVQRVRRDDTVHEISDDDDDVQYIDPARDDEVLIPCEFCDRQFSVDTVSHHQITCGNNHEFGLGAYD